MASGQSTTTDKDDILDGILPSGDGPMRLDRALAVAIPDLSRERIKALIQQHRLTVGGKVITDPSAKKHSGQQFALSLPPPIEAEAKPQDIPLDIAYEDEHLIIVDKPAGFVVHPAAGHADGTLVNALLHHCAGQLSGIGGVSRPGIVHRIDKDTSGLIVAAKSDKAHEGLSKLFAAHDIDRKYRAITNNIPSPISGSIEENVGRSPHDRKKMAVVDFGHGKTAITHYTMLKSLDNAALVECVLETGRTHQVRVHMAHIGSSLIGDPLYGSKRRAKNLGPARANFSRQALHAAILGFIHPITGEKILCESEIPADMRELLAELSV